jgi:hypothetical protein
MQPGLSASAPSLEEMDAAAAHDNLASSNITVSEEQVVLKYSLIVVFTCWSSKRQLSTEVATDSSELLRTIE